MKRRELIQACAMAALFPEGLIAGNSVFAANTGISRYSRFFFDERFVDPATQLSNVVNDVLLVPVRSDVTAVWTGMLSRAARQQSLALQGLTTESFVFCLQRLLHGSHAVEVSMQRVSQDLYGWSLVADHKNINRRVA
jgi:hypothetical protein